MSTVNPPMGSVRNPVAIDIRHRQRPGRKPVETNEPVKSAVPLAQQGLDAVAQVFAV